MDYFDYLISASSHFSDTVANKYAAANNTYVIFLMLAIEL